MNPFKTYTSRKDIIKVPPLFPTPLIGPYKRLFAYLMGRGIPQEVIQLLIDERLVYQSAEYNDIVFINREQDFAEIRSTNTYGKKQYRGATQNSRKDGYWYMYSSGDADHAYVCESAIDAISLFLIHKQDESINEEAYYISIAGATKQKAIDRIKQQFHVVIAADNDEAGYKCRQRNADCESVIPTFKDWNEDLTRIYS